MEMKQEIKDRLVSVLNDVETDINFDKIIEETKKRFYDTDKDGYFELVDSKNEGVVIFAKSDVKELRLTKTINGLECTVYFKNINNSYTSITIAKPPAVSAKSLLDEPSKDKRYKIMYEGKKYDVYIVIDMYHNAGFCGTKLLDLQGKGIVKLLPLDKYEEVMKDVTIKE